MKKQKTALVVIGAGPAGYAAAFRAADLGIETTLIDPEENPGGVCLYRGCIPSKALLHISQLKMEALEAENMGLVFKEPKLDLDKLRSWKDDQVVKKLTDGLGSLTRARKIKYIRGYANFKDAKTLLVNEKDSKNKIQLNFDSCIIATGSVPATLPDVAFDEKVILSSRGALDIPDIPGSLLVIGGGYIGLELGSVYARLGSKVTVAEMTGSLLPGTDRDLVKIFTSKNENIFSEIHLNTRVSEIKKGKDSARVIFEKKGEEQEKKDFDKVLIAIGRNPNSGNLDLENAGVRVSGKGFIPVDGQQRTNIDGIYAIGDITGEPMLAHKGSHEGIVAAEVIAGNKAEFDPKAIPAVVFTDPEIAWCGLTEGEAKEKKIRIKVARFPWKASGRALTLGEQTGITKLIIDPATERILGVAIAGKDAGSLIPEGVLAVEAGLTAKDLSLTIFPHPTLSETLKEAAESFYGLATHFK